MKLCCGRVNAVNTANCRNSVRRRRFTSTTYNRAVGGPTTATNLALACVSCSLRKWAHQTALDPESGEEVPVFNPRTQAWNDHFRWDGARVVPLTATGRATVAMLAMNRPGIIAIRVEEMERGRHPPT
jgi:hypothetical protein